MALKHRKKVENYKIIKKKELKKRTKLILEFVLILQVL